MCSFTHTIAFGHITFVAQHAHRHVIDVKTEIDEQWNRWKDKRAQKSTTEVSFCTIIMFESVYNGDHDSVVRIFVGLFCEL